jgi:hypothetical protein
VVSFNAKKGLITVGGTPTQAVNSPGNLSVTVVDHAGATVTKRYTLVIKNRKGR